MNYVQETVKTTSTFKVLSLSQVKQEINLSRSYKASYVVPQSDLLICSKELLERVLWIQKRAVCIRTTGRLPMFNELN